MRSAQMLSWCTAPARNVSLAQTITVFFVAHHLAGFTGVPDLAEPPAVSDGRDDAVDVGHAHVRLEKLLLDLVEEFVIDLPAGDEEGADVGVEHRRGLPQGAFELVEGFG